MKRINTSKVIMVLLLILSLTAFGGISYAEKGAYPTKPIEWIIPYGAGGSTDLGMRIMGGAMSQTLGVPIIPINKPGAGGMTGADYTARQPADGYTVATGSVAQNNIQLAMDAQAPFSNDDFTFISMYLTQEILVVVKADSPWKTMDDLIKAARENPGTVSFSTSGVGTSLHIGGELVKMVTETDLLHVPFKSGPESMAAILGGHVNFGMHLTGDAKTMLDSGEIRALATLSPERLAEFPDVPTLTELGYENAVLYSWHGLVGPKGMPKEVVEKLHDAAKAAIESPSVQAMIKKIGATPTYLGPPEEFEKFVRENAERVAAIVKAAGLEK
jgi:tripartite-type tricarboxylate transporter receptor subunit TctC